MTTTKYIPQQSLSHTIHTHMENKTTHISNLIFLKIEQKYVSKVHTTPCLIISDMIANFKHLGKNVLSGLFSSLHSLKFEPPSATSIIPQRIVV